MNILLTTFILFFSLSLFSEDRVGGNLKSGTTMPDLPLYTLDNQRFMLYEVLEKLSPDRYLLINFTSTSCKPCKEEIPELIKIKQAHSRIELYFIFVGDQNEAIEAKVQELKIPSENRFLKDPLETALRRLNIKAVPMTYLLGRDKIISAFSIGYTPEKFKEFKNQIKGILN